MFKRRFDDTTAALRRAPKFPSNMPIRLLLRAHARTGDDVALLMAALTLEKMAAGGMYDQLGGRLPPLLDRRALAGAALREDALRQRAAGRRLRRGPPGDGRADFARVARETLDYLLREMTAPEGGFYSATDADSKRPDGKSEEGAFFVWSEAEIRQVLGDGAEAERFIRHYGVTAEGNFEGANILAVAAPDPRDGEHAALAPQRASACTRRGREAVAPVPRRQDPRRLERPGDLGGGGGGADIRRAPLRRRRGRARRRSCSRTCAPGGRLARSAKDGRPGAPASSTTTRSSCAGLIDLFEATFEPRWLREAIALADDTERLFADPAGGWFMTADDHERLIAREKPAYDGAEPSGTSVALLNALRLGRSPPTIAGARSPTARSRRSPRRSARTRSR